MDGTGNPWHYGDVAIENGRIAAMGHNLDDEAKQIIDVSGLTIARAEIGRASCRERV